MAHIGSSMTAEEIRTGVRALEPWFHQIELGHGILTKSRPAATEPLDHPQNTWRIIKDCLPGDLSGRSVVDVGCNAGFYSVQAKYRNAARVLGIDAQRHEIRQAQFVARALDLQIEFKRMSVYDLSASRDGRFDIVLALGLIYHCKHPLLALERLFQVTGDMMVLESAVAAPKRLFQSFADSSGIGRRFHALAYIENDPAAWEAVYNWFIPTVDCLKAMLSDTGFIDIKVIYEDNGRAVIVCSRPREDPDSLTAPHLLGAHLSMVHGASSSRPGQPMNFQIRIRNSGQSVWLRPGAGAGNKGAVRLGVHLLDERGQDVVHDYGGIQIPEPIKPGGEILMSITVAAPLQPGSYQLEFDMVSEQLTWFEDAGMTIPLAHVIRVE